MNSSNSRSGAVNIHTGAKDCSAPAVPSIKELAFSIGLDGRRL
jgi:hypothetical protein